jgi:hypothetical protein
MYVFEGMIIINFCATAILYVGWSTRRPPTVAAMGVLNSAAGGVVVGPVGVPDTIVLFYLWVVCWWLTHHYIKYLIWTCSLHLNAVIVPPFLALVLRA